VIVELADEGPNGLASMMGKLIATNLEQHPERKRLLRPATIRISAVDIGLRITLKIEADRVAILHGGRIVEEGTPGEVAAGALPRLRFRLARALAPSELGDLSLSLAAVAATARPVAEPGDGTGSYRVDGASPGPDLVAALATWCARAGVQLVELRAAAATLEERYLELTGDRDVEAVA